MKDTLPDSGFFTEDLATRDPAIFGAIRDELDPPARRDRADRLGEHRLPRRAPGAGLGDDQQVRRGLSGPALLRRLPVRRRRRDPRDRARLQALRRRLRQRAAELRQPGQPGGVPRAAQARRHLPRDGPLRRRPPDPRREAQHVGQVVQRRSHYGVRKQDQRLDYDAVAELAASTSPKLIIAGGSAIPRQIDFARFREIADERRRLPDGRHGALRRPRRRRPAPEPGAARPRRHHHHPQDPARPARRHDPDQRRGDRQEDQLGDLPRPAGRPPDARHRRQGRRLRRGAAPRVRRLRRERGQERRRPRRRR